MASSSPVSAGAQHVPQAAHQRYHSGRAAAGSRISEEEKHAKDNLRRGVTLPVPLSL